MKPSLSPIFLISALISGGIAGGGSVRPTKCDVGYACSVLDGLSTRSSFCSSYLHATAKSTKTTTITVTVTSSCTTQTTTKTRTIHATTTETEYGETTTLPTITLTEYSSSVLIPSGPNPSIDKRLAPPATPSNQPTTPTALGNCAAPTISSGCSHLVAPQTTTVTATSTSTKPQKCTDTTTMTTTTTITDRTTTTTIPFLVSPPPVILTSTGVLTTTVPAACASTPYHPNGGNGVGNNIIPLGYPYFPQTGVECCVVCFSQENCIASAVIYDGTQVVECELLIHVNGTQPGPTNLCQLGIQDYDFGSPQVDGNVYPGPCGA